MVSVVNVTIMETKEIRAHSSKTASKAGIQIPATLPLLEEGLCVRPVSEAVNRLLVLHVLAAVAYGFDRMKALAWLKQEKLEKLLTPTESAFVTSGVGTPMTFQVQIEAMWALAWALGLVPQIDFWKDCDNRFAAMLPDLKINQSGAEWHAKARMRSADELITACDLAYCLHWAARQAQLEHKAPPVRLKSYVVEERRRSLEWLLSNEQWDAVSLDT